MGALYLYVFKMCVPESEIRKELQDTVDLTTETNAILLHYQQIYLNGILKQTALSEIIMVYYVKEYLNVL